LEALIRDSEHRPVCSQGTPTVSVSFLAKRRDACHNTGEGKPRKRRKGGEHNINSIERVTKYKIKRVEMKADIGQQQYLLCVQGRKRGGYFQILQQHCSSKAPGEKREALRQESSQPEGEKRRGGKKG